MKNSSTADLGEFLPHDKVDRQKRTDLAKSSLFTANFCFYHWLHSVCGRLKHRLIVHKRIYLWLKVLTDGLSAALQPIRRRSFVELRVT